MKNQYTLSSLEFFSFPFLSFIMHSERERREQRDKNRLVGWLFGIYGISTFVGYLMSNPFLYK